MRPMMYFAAISNGLKRIDIQKRFTQTWELARSNPRCRERNLDRQEWCVSTGSMGYYLPAHIR